MAETNNNTQAQTGTNPANAGTNTTTPATVTESNQVTEPPAQQTSQTQQEKTFTQEEVNAIAARQKDEGRQAVLKKYGLTEEQLEQIAPILNPKSAVEPPAQHDNTEMLKRVLIAETKGELAIAGVKADAVDDMVTLVSSRLNPADYTADAIKEAIKDIKARHVSSFASQTNMATGAVGTGNNLAAGATNNQKADGKTVFGEPGALGRMLANKK